MRDWLELQKFPRSNRLDVNAFDWHLRTQLSSEEHRKIQGTSQWLGNVINLHVNDDRTASSVRNFFQRILPHRLATSPDEAQYEDQISVLALRMGPGTESQPNGK